MRPLFLDQPNVRTARTLQSKADYASAVTRYDVKETGFSTAWWVVVTMIAVGTFLVLTLGD